MSDSKNSRTIILTWLVNLSVSFLRLLFGTRMQVIFTIIVYHLYVSKILSVSPLYKKKFPPMSSSPISETFIFSHTHKHKRTHHQFFTFLVEKKERKIVSSSASKNLFRTPSVKVQSHTLRVRKPAHDHVSSSSRAENRVALPAAPLWKIDPWLSIKGRGASRGTASLTIDYMCCEVNNVAYRRVAANPAR